MTLKYSQSTELPVKNDMIDCAKHGEHPTSKRSGLKSHIIGATFYIALVAILAGTFIFTSNSGEAGMPRHFAGFSAMRVLTDSMQNELPQDSLIITRRTSPDDIQVGDNITFMVKKNRTVTHRVVAIYENFADTGQRGFQTQGTMNPQPDWEIVTPNNIIGRVVFHNLFIGRTIRFISENIIIITVFSALLIGFFIALKALILPNKKGKANGIYLHPCARSGTHAKT